MLQNFLCVFFSCTGRKKIHKIMLLLRETKEEDDFFPLPNMETKYVARLIKSNMTFLLEASSCVHDSYLDR